MIPWWLAPLMLDILIVFVAGVFGRAQDLPYASFCAAGVLILGLAATIPIWAIFGLASIFL